MFLLYISIFFRLPGTGWYNIMNEDINQVWSLKLYFEMYLIESKILTNWGKKFSRNVKIVHREPARSYTVVVIIIPKIINIDLIPNRILSTHYSSLNILIHCVCMEWISIIFCSSFLAKLLFSTTDAKRSKFPGAHYTQQYRVLKRGAGPKG